MKGAERYHQHLVFRDANDYLRFRQVLLDAGYSDAAILRTIGSIGGSPIQGDDIPLLLHRTRGDTPLETLVRLFLIEVPVSLEAARAAARPMAIETWEEAGLIRIGKDFVIGSVKLLPFQNLFIAFDSPQRLLRSDARDYVMGIGRSSLTLANLTIRRKSRSTLDLGTGCGIQAFLAAEHSDTVFGTDANPRAIEFARFNALLNGMKKVILLGGDLFEPVEGKQFDLILSSPPFVVSPHKSYFYRDGGDGSEGICERLVRRVPTHLREGGYAQILANWPEKAGKEWSGEVRRWVEGVGCDTWVLRSESRDAATYASTWIRHTERGSPAVLARRFRQWMEYYERLGIDALGAGIVNMRRSKGKRTFWFATQEAPSKMLGPCGEAIAEGFQVRDLLEERSTDEELLILAPVVAPGVRLETRHTKAQEGWTGPEVWVRMTDGLAYEGRVDSCLADLLMQLDGRRSLGSLLDGMAEKLGVSRETASGPFCLIVRQLLQQGFLLSQSLPQKQAGAATPQ